MRASTAISKFASTSKFAVAAVVLAGTAAPLAADIANAFFVDSPDYTRNGSAVYNSGQRLTTDGGQAGSLWHNDKQEVTTGFVATFRFRIEAGPTAQIPGDGFAFVIQDSPQGTAALGTGGSGIGYEGIPRSFAVEFDTFCFDGELPCAHVSVQTAGVESNSNDDALSRGAATLSDFGIDILDGREHTCMIEYVPPSLDESGPEPVETAGVLRVQLDGLAVLTIDVGYASGLESMGLADENGSAFVGFTAGTGLADSVHVITDFAFDDATAGQCVQPYWHVTGWGSGGVGSCGGVSAQFVGSLPMDFAWYRNGVLIPDDDGGRITGLNTDSLQICDLTLADNGYYYCVATNACGSITSFEQAALQPCRVDFNLDGNIDPDDLGDYINCYFSEPPCPQADYNFDTNIDPDDLGDYINEYFGNPCQG